MSDLVGTQIVGFLTHRLICSYSKFWMAIVCEVGEKIAPFHYTVELFIIVFKYSMLKCNVEIRQVEYLIII